MDVKEAIGRARDYLGMVFSDEDISEVRLELDFGQLRGVLSGVR